LLAPPLVLLDDLDDATRRQFVSGAAAAVLLAGRGAIPSGAGSSAGPNLEAVPRLTLTLVVTGEPRGLPGQFNVELFREPRDRLAATRVPVFAVTNGYQTVDAHMRFPADPPTRRPRGQAGRGSTERLALSMSQRELSSHSHA